MHFLYILHSLSADKYYVGETSDPQKRLDEHLLHKYKKGFTKTADDWKMVLQVKVESREKAVLLERYIKRMKSRKFIQKIIGSPEMLEDIWKNR